MSALSMSPKFTDRAGYNKWRAEWRIVYAQLSKDIRAGKLNVKNTQKAGEPAGHLQSNLHYDRVMAYKAMSLLDEAKLRMKRIYKMEKQIKAQNAKLPLVITDCRVLDFHFNKGAMEFKQLPMWVIRTKGEQYFVNHFTADGGVPLSTRELPDAPSTKGMLRFRNCILSIDVDGNASLTTSPKSEPVTVAIDAPVPEEVPLQQAA